MAQANYMFFVPAQRRRVHHLVITKKGNRLWRKAAIAPKNSGSVKARPLPDKCAEGQHSYNRFGKYQETCIRCGQLNPTIVTWRMLLDVAVELGVPQLKQPTHPYLKWLVPGGTDWKGEARPAKVAWTPKEMKAYFANRRKR